MYQTKYQLLRRLRQLFSEWGNITKQQLRKINIIFNIYMRTETLLKSYCDIREDYPAVKMVY